MSIIKCRTCNSNMIVDRCESSGNATTCWHQCPVCKQVRLTSECDSAISPREFASQADEDTVIASDFELTNGSSYTL